MAYNTTTERLLNAIKNNTANITLSGDINAIDAATKSAILATDAATTQTELDTNYLVLGADGLTPRDTNLATVAAAIAALTADNTDNAGNDVTLEDLRLLLKTIDTDTGNIDTSLNNIETNSDTSLGKNGFSFHNASATGQSGKAAVQFLTESVVTGITGGSITGTVAGTLPAGTIIYGDITSVSISSGSFLLYNV